MTAERRTLLVLVLLTGAPALLQGQLVIEDYEPAAGMLRIGPDPQEAIPMVAKGHTLVLPENVEARGIIVMLDGWPTSWGPEDPGAGSFDDAALARGVGMLHINTGNRLDFYFDSATMADVSDRIQSLLSDQDMDGVPVYFAGLSLGGTRALKLAVYLAQNSGAYWLRPRAVAVVDAPLDMIRFWYAEQAAIRIGFHANAAGEGRWVSYMLETNLGGTPEDQRDRYTSYSPYTHGALNGGNAAYLVDLPIRTYHEPDVDWWIENRRKSYYEMNSLDLAGLITELRIQGNEHAELVTTNQKRSGYEEGSSPHSWSIVDNAELVEWFLEMGGRPRR